MTQEAATVTEAVYNDTQGKAEIADLGRQLALAIEAAWTAGDAGEDEVDEVKRVMQIATDLGKRLGAKVDVGNMPLQAAALYLFALLAAQ